MAGPEHNHITGAKMVAPGDVVQLSVLGYAGAVIQLSGTWTGTVTFEGSQNGTDFVSMAALDLRKRLGDFTGIRPGRPSTPTPPGCARPSIGRRHSRSG